MPTFALKDGLFWLDDQPLFIHAGEFHYFRAPADQWEHRLNLLLQAGFNTVAVYIPWLWHQPQPELSDVDGHTHPLRDLAGFLNLATRMGLYIIARPGPYIMAETINEGIPQWVFDQHPQVAFIGQDGQTQNIVSYLHPDYLACVEGWYREVFRVLTPRQITHGGNILMIQLDNEMAMLQWLRNKTDINTDTLGRFAAHLQARYGAGLPQRYPATNLTDFLRDQLCAPQQPHGERVIEDYRRFYRTYLRDYMAWLWERARSHGMDTPPVVNIHGFGNGGKTFPIGLSQLTEVMALDGMVSATDVYPIFIGEGNIHHLLLVNEMTKALHNPQQALFCIEFQAGGNLDFGGSQSSLYDLHSRLSISSGMRAINHYLFFDGENDPLISPQKRHDWGHPVRKDGTTRRHYARYPKLSRVLAAYGEELVRARPRTVTTIGFQLDAYMTEVNNALSKPATDILTHQRDVLLFDLLARGLTLTHRPFNALELTRTLLDAVKTPVLWVMMDKQCDEATQCKLADYVEQGGKLVLVGRLCDQTFDHEPCTILQDVLGIQIVHTQPPFTPARIRAFDYPDTPASFVETYSGAFDEVFATAADGGAVGFIRTVGKGRVMVLGAALAANTLDDLDILHRMAERMGIPPLFTLSDWADVRVSEGEKGNFLFISNYQDDPLETTVALYGAPLFGGHALTLPARRGLILPLDWQVRQGVVVHYLTSEVIGVEEDGGRLRLRTEAADCVGEISLQGWRCDETLVVEYMAGDRLKLRVKNGLIELWR